jgi:hypothetical protein
MQRLEIIPVQINMGSGRYSGIMTSNGGGECRDRSENIIRNCHCFGDRPYQRLLRIEQGQRMPGFELTDDYNPLDAGLWNTGFPIQ